MFLYLHHEQGQALILAVAILAATSLVSAGMLMAAWDATEAALQARARVQAAQAAASASELHFAVLSRVLRGKLPQNLLNQGCRQQDQIGTTCLVPGNDTAGTSGIRRDRIQQLASQSVQGWEQLQSAFVEALRQVMPLAPEQDRHRTPTTWGFAGLALSSANPSMLPNVIWMAYGIVAPVPFAPIQFNATTRKAVIPFEVRAYGWAVRTSAPSGAPVSRAQVTTYATTGTLTLTYPDCPSYWPNPPDQICQYPDSVQVNIPERTAVLGDPAVMWPQGWP